MTPLLLLALLAATPVSLEEALLRAEQTAGVRGASEAVSERRTLSGQASALTSNPVVSVQPGARAIHSPGPEVLVAVEQSFNLAGQGSARRASLAAELDEAQAAVRGERLAARLKVADAWVARWLAARLQRLADTEAQTAQSLLEKVERAARAEALTRIEVATAQAWRTETQLAVLSAEGDRFEATVRLAVALGEGPATQLEVSAELPKVPLSLARDPGSSPEVVQLRAAAGAERSRAKEAQASRGLALRVGAQGSRESDGALLGALTLGLHLPMFDRAERERATLESAARRLEARAEVALLEATATQAIALHEVEHSAEVLEAVRTALLPSARDAAAGTERLFERGEATVHDVFLTRRALVAAQVRLERAEATHALALIRARELTFLPGESR